MIAGVLRKLVQEQLTSPQELGELAGVSISTVYRWMNGQSHPSCNTVCQMIHRMPNHQAQGALISALLQDLPWVFFHVPEETPGEVDPGRPMAGLDQLLMTLRQALDELSQAQAGATAGGDELHQIVHSLPMLDRLLKQVAQTQRRWQRAAQGLVESPVVLPGKHGRLQEVAAMPRSSAAPGGNGGHGGNGGNGGNGGHDG